MYFSLELSDFFFVTYSTDFPLAGPDSRGNLDPAYTAEDRGNTLYELGNNRFLRNNWNLSFAYHYFIWDGLGSAR
jgi:hypothetical protein